MASGLTITSTKNTFRAILSVHPYHAGFKELMPRQNRSELFVAWTLGKKCQVAGK